MSAVAVRNAVSWRQTRSRGPNLRLIRAIIIGTKTGHGVPPQYLVLQLKWRRAVPDALSKALAPNLLGASKIGLVGVRKNIPQVRLSM
jgi:hypothetical protein